MTPPPMPSTSASVTACSRASGRSRTTVTRDSPKISLRELAERLRSHRPRRGAAGDDDVAERRLEHLEHATASLSATIPTSPTRRVRRRPPRGPRRRPRPVRVVGSIDEDGGRPAARPRGGRARSSWRRRQRAPRARCAVPPPDEGLDGRDRGGEVAGPVGTVQREEEVGILACEPAEAGLAGRRGRPHGSARRSRCPRRRFGSPPTSLTRSSRTCATSSSRPPDGDRAGLDDPAFSSEIETTSSPSRCVWSRSTGVTTATCASMTLVASHEPPRPTRRSRRRRKAGEGGVGERDEHLEEVHPAATRLERSRVDDVDERSHLVEGGDELLTAGRLARQGDPLTDVVQVRRREATGRQPALAQDRVDHPARRRLAVGPGEVDRRVGTWGSPASPSPR